jgi:hypothetical protein
MTTLFIRRTCFVGTVILSLAVFSSCLKTRSGETDFSGLQDYVIFQSGGTVNFTGANVSAGATAPDTVTLSAIVTLASRNVASSDLTVKVGLDETKRTEYNSANGTNYQAFPANTYKILTPTVTIPAGQNYATVKIEIYPRNIDQAVSYLLPLTITDAGGKNLSGNLNTVYYHIIGNPLAGKYNTVGTRYNYGGSVSYSCGSAIPGGYVSTNASPTPKTASPIDAKTISIGYANLEGNGYHYLVKIDPANPNNAIVTSDATLAAALAVTYCVHTYDPALKQFHILSWYNNGTADRIIDEVFTHQ